jgi:bis(5'-nucleosyl)-tetraphosphatase (symmetrical)
MTVWAIGDIQGCYDELRELVARLSFSPDRDRLWFTGDLVNRGPRSLDTLRYVRSLGDSAITVLGNHDLHLLAVAYGTKRKIKSGDTLEDVLTARDREPLLEWLLSQPLAHFDDERQTLLVHAGLVPQWSAPTALSLAREVQNALRKDPRALFDEMYGDQPDRWNDSLKGMDRLRFAINSLTRLRICTKDGKVDLKMKGGSKDIKLPYRPWFEWDDRASRDVRVVFGHWSALGLVREHNVVGLDTGCVWGGALTALDIDDPEAKPVSQPCRGYQDVGE